MSEPKLVLDAEGMDRAISRIAHEILEKHPQTEHLVLVGIRTRGVYLAERMKNQMSKLSGKEIDLGILDITLYRDDLSEIGPRASVKETDMPCDLQDKSVVLVDDVFFTGRTTRAALDAIHDLGRPKVIQLAVLIDRGHRELPLKADYVGKNIPTSRDEQVVVSMKEIDGKDEVMVRKGGKV